MRIIYKFIFLLIAVSLLSNQLLCQENQKRKKIDSLFTIGNFQIQNNLYLESNATADELLLVYPSPESHLFKATTLMNGKISLADDPQLLQETFKHLETSLKLDSTFYYAFGHLGLLSFIAGDFQNSIKYYSLYLQYTKDNTEIFNAITDRASAKAYFGDLEGAILDYEEAMKIDSTNPVIFQNLSTFLIRDGEFKEAKKLLLKGILLHPYDELILNNLGFAELKLKHYDEAKGYFNTAIAINPDSYLAYANRGFCQLRTDELDGAEDDFLKSKKINPQNCYLYKYLGFFYKEKNDTSKACECWKIALDLGYSKMYDSEVENLIKENCK